ncbi:MAG: peptidoglycan DD-metalloendopeptidase family protein [Parcubacteria group bacterium]|nr:peptidoglycan DD-metalloendopeptidase family protein [Parcubacteria group bacterium]
MEGVFRTEDAFFSYPGSGGSQTDGPLVINEIAYGAPNTPLTIEASENERTDIITYTVTGGDNPSTIAASFGITTQTLLWANRLEDGDVIKPGQQLAILPTDGVIHRVAAGESVLGLATKFKGNVDEIIAFNDLPADGALQSGDTLVIPDGEFPAPPAPPRKRIASQRLASLASGTYFSYPTTGRNLGRIHGQNGVDISNACGTPIYAAAAGSITLADSSGWNYGFGKYITVAHPNGTGTLYAHLSYVGVSYGQVVERGQLIGYMGTTGRSTGCHLHFEVHGARNPLAR